MSRNTRNNAAAVQAVNHKSDSTESNGSPGNPVVCLILWALAASGRPAKDLPPVLGISQADLDRLVSRHSRELEEMKNLRLAAELVDRDMLAKLVRVRLATKLLETENPRELAALSTAAAKLPDWIFDEAAAPGSEEADRTTQSGLKNGSTAAADRKSPSYGYENDPSLHRALAEARRHAAEWEADGLPDV